MSESSPFGTRLREIRTAAGLTLEALAERSGVSERTISDIERGISATPRRATIDALAVGLSLNDAHTQAFLRAARAGRRARFRDGPPASVLPHRVNDFTGREREISTVLAMLAPEAARVAPVVAITGAPGSGKTTVAWEALHRAQLSSQALLFVDLDGFSALPLTPLQVLTALLRQLPGLEDDMPASLADAVRLWTSATAERPVAVLLDNAASESQIRPALAVGAGSAIVVTSRRSLSGLEGARRVPLGPLSTDESTALLRQLVTPAQRDDLGIPELARLCDDLPLALRILGNRIASRPARRPSDFLLRLRSEEGRLRTLVAGDLAIEAAFSLSYEELDPRTADLFRSLAVIDGGTFEVRLATAVAALEPDDANEIEFRLEDLTDLGLIEARGEDRYRLHDLIRLFALGRLRDQVGESGVRARRLRMRDWLLASLGHAGSWFEPQRTAASSGGDADGAVFAGRDAAAAWIRSEVVHWWPALQRAAADADHRRVVDVADSLHWFSDTWMSWGNWYAFFSLGVQSARAIDDPLMEATHLGYVAWAEVVEIGDSERAVLTAGQALAAADRADDDTQRGWANYYRAWALWKLSRYEEGTAAVRAAIDTFHAAADDGGLEQAVLLTAVLKGAQGDQEAMLAELLGIVDRLTTNSRPAHPFVAKISVYAVYLFLTDTYRRLGRAQDAVDAATAGLALARELGDESRIARLLRRRAEAYLLLDDRDRAVADIDEGLSLVHPASVDAALLTEVRATMTGGVADAE